MDVSDTSDYSGSNFSSLSHTIFNEDLLDVKNQLNCASKDDPGYKNDLDNLEKVIELKFYKKFDKLMRLNVQLESKLSDANKFINSLQNDTILDSELKKLNFDLNFKINELECELTALKCNIQNNEKFLDSLRCENEEKRVLIDLKNNSIVCLKNKIVELHLQLLETKQINSRSDHGLAVLTNELNAIKKSEEWYKKSLSECRLQKSALIEEVTNLQLQLITKNRDLQLEKLKKLDEKQKNYQIEAIEILTNELVDTKEICKRQKIAFDRIDGENQNLIAENGRLLSKLGENEMLIGNVQKLNEKIRNCSCCNNQTVSPSCIYPSPDVSFSETDFRHFDLFAPVNEDSRQIPSKERADKKSNSRELTMAAEETNWICEKNSVSATPVVKNQGVDDTEYQDLVKKIFDLDSEIQELKKSNNFSKNLLTTEIQQHEETVAELGIQYMGLQNEIGHLKDSNFRYFSELENLQISFQEVQEANKMNENQVETMQLENQDLKLEKLCYQTQIQSFRTENENLVRKHNGEVDKLKESVNAKICLLGDIKTENNDLKTTRSIEVQKHKEEIAELEMQLCDLLSQIENLHCAKSQLQIETSTFRREIEELKILKKAEEEMAKQDLCGQILNLHKKIEECQSKLSLEVKIKEELMREMQKEETIKGELQKELTDLQNEIRNCKCNSEVIVLQNIIEELKNAMEMKENLIIGSKEEIKRFNEVEIERNLEVESMQNLIKKLKGEANSSEENEDRLAGQVLALQNEILKLEAESKRFKEVEVESMQNLIKQLKGEADSAEENQDRLAGQVLALQNEILKLEAESKRFREVEVESMQNLIKKLKGEADLAEENEDRLAGQVLALQNEILQLEAESKRFREVEVESMQNLIKKLKGDADLAEENQDRLAGQVLALQNEILQLEAESKRFREVEVESMQNLIKKLKGDADLAEENQDRLAGQVLALQNEILKSEAMKHIHIENIRKTSMELAESNDSILGLVANLNMESDVSIAKLKNENFDLRIETENLHGVIRKLEGELDGHDVKVPKSSFGGKNILFEPEVDDDLQVPNLVNPEGEEIIILKVEIKRLSALCKAKEMQNEENRERCEKGNRSLLSEINEYKRRCAKMQKMYKQVSEELNSYKFNTNISKNEQIECSCDNYKNLLHNLNTHIEDLKQIGATEMFVQNGRTVHNDERITTNRPTSKTAMQKSIDNLQEEIDILQGDLVKTRSEKYFLQRLCKDLKFSLQCCTSQTKMLKKQNEILKSLDCGKFSALLSKMPSPNKCDDTFIKELIKSSCQYQNPIRNLKSSMDLCKEEVIKLQKLVS